MSTGSADAAVPVHVAVAVLKDAQGRVLLSRRPEHVHQGGLWEFPGGKLEPEEGILQALAREAREELGVEIVASYPLIRVNHRYPDKNVLLDVHMVTGFIGTPHGREGQPLAWVGTDEFDAYPMPAADHPIINAIRLPEVYLITGDGSEDQAEFLGQLEEALCRGCRLVQLRRPGLKRPDYLGLAEKALTLCRSHNAELLLNADVEDAIALGASGVHLNSRRLMDLKHRPLSGLAWVAASCHNESELRHAERVGVDFAVLSPVLKTASHPGADVLGWKRFSQLAETSSIPLYALGGMDVRYLDEARTHGAQGVAGITGFWRV